MGYLFHDFFFPIHGIYEWLSVVKTKGFFHRDWIRRVNLEGKVSDALNLLDDGLHHFALINFRKSHVHVQNLRALFLLRDSLVQDVGNVIVLECLLEFFLSRGIDSFANQNRLPSELNDFCSRCYGRFF